MVMFNLLELLYNTATYVYSPWTLLGLFIMQVPFGKEAFVHFVARPFTFPSVTSIMPFSVPSALLKMA
jgi:hypothetical protein